MCAIEGVLRSWLSADADRENTGFGSTSNAGDIATKGAKFLFLFVEFFLGNDFKMLGLLRLFFCHCYLLLGWHVGSAHRYVWEGSPSKSASPTATTPEVATSTRAAAAVTCIPVESTQDGVGR